MSSDVNFRPDFLLNLHLASRSPHNSLSCRLDELRTNASLALKDLFKCIPDDHPMRSSVTAFGMIGYGRRETAYTRSLSWLLSPTESHGFGDAILQHVLPYLMDEDDAQFFRPSRVISEYNLPLVGKGIGRVDIWIEGRIDAGKNNGSTIIAIEAKVDAPENIQQCIKYREAIEKLKFKNRYMVLLSEAKQVGKFPRSWTRLSYTDLAVCIWNAATSNSHAPGYQFVRLFLTGILGDLLHWPLPVEETTTRPFEIYSYLKHEEGAT